MLVTVIIPVYKDDERLNLCLQALDKQNFPKDEFEVMLINNDPDGELKIDTNYDFPLTIENENLKGSYAARNKGIRLAKGDILAFTDSDAIPDPDWIAEGVRSMKSASGEKIILAGKVQLTFENPTRMRFAECYEKYFGFPHQRNPGKTLPVMVAGNFFIRSDTFREIGLFNPSLTSGGDTEFSNRAVEKGYQIIYNPECTVLHPAKGSLNDLLKKRRRIFGGKVFRLIRIEKRYKIISVIRIFGNQTIRYLKELIIAITGLRVGKSSDRIKLIITIILIMLSLFYESFAIIIANKMRRR